MKFKILRKPAYKRKLIAGFLFLIYLFAILPSQYFHHFFEKKHEKHFVCKAAKNMKHFHSKKVKCLLNEWRKVTVGGYNGSPLQYQNILQTLSKKVLYKNNYSVIFSSYYDSRGPPQYAI